MNSGHQAGAVGIPHFRAAHRVDAISVVEPFLAGAEQSIGAKVVMSECSGPTAGFPLSGYFATAAWTRQYPKTARAFQRAMAKAQALASSDPAAVQQILPTCTQIPSQAAQQVNLSSFPATTQAAQLQRVADLMLAGRLVKSRCTVRLVRGQESGSARAAPAEIAPAETAR